MVRSRRYTPPVNAVVKRADCDVSTQGRAKTPKIIQKGKNKWKINGAHVGRMYSLQARWNIDGWNSFGDRVMTIVGTFQVGCRIGCVPHEAIPAELVRKRGLFGSKLINKQHFYQRLVSHSHRNQASPHYKVFVGNNIEAATPLGVLTGNAEVRQGRLDSLTGQALPNRTWIALTNEGKTLFATKWETWCENWIHQSLRDHTKQIARDGRYDMTENAWKADPPANNIELKNKICTYYCTTVTTQEIVAYLFDNPGWQRNKVVKNELTESLCEKSAKSSFASTTLAVETQTLNEHTCHRIRPHILVAAEDRHNQSLSAFLNLQNVSDGDSANAAESQNPSYDDSDDELHLSM